MGGPLWTDIATRDPSITYYNGKWWVAFTGGSTTPGFAVRSTSDFRTWDAEFDVSVSGAHGALGNTDRTNTWAPEWFIDDDGSLSAYFAVVSYISSSFYLWEIHPTADDLSTWSTPVMVSQSGEYNTIGPFVPVKTGNWATFPDLHEAPALVKVSNTT